MLKRISIGHLENLVTDSKRRLEIHDQGLIVFKRKKSGKVIKASIKNQDTESELKFETNLSILYFGKVSHKIYRDALLTEIDNFLAKKNFYICEADYHQNWRGNQELRGCLYSEPARNFVSDEKLMPTAYFE
ncbi:MAG: hypothetical protein AABW50_05100 [Nanoarchaeota archaeon]